VAYLHLDLIKRSIYYWLANLFYNATWDGGSSYPFRQIASPDRILLAYPGSDELVKLDTVEIPAISIDHSSTGLTPFELGESDSQTRRILVIDVFARDVPERDNITDYILKQIDRNDVILYDFNSGSPSESNAPYTFGGIPTLGLIEFVSDSWTFNTFDNPIGESKELFQHTATIIGAALVRRTNEY